MIRGDHCRKPSFTASRTAPMTCPEYCPIRARRPSVSSSGIEICTDSRKQATPSTGSAQRGPCWVESWKPVWMLSSKRRAEREEGREWWVWVGVDVPLVEVGVEVPFGVAWSEGWKLVSMGDLMVGVHFSKVEICKVDEDVWTYSFGAECTDSSHQHDECGEDEPVDYGFPFSTFGD